ncbi:MAG: hypothetical protein ACRDQX_09120 [Pseudonocardiaceae bacterium]
MTASATSPAGGPPSVIFIIRHGEKPADPPPPVPGAPPLAADPPFGVDINGNQNPHSLLPCGWQRCGALTVLFAPANGTPPAGLAPPSALFSPTYGTPDKTALHRTYQTIQGTAERLRLSIENPNAEGDERALIETLIDQRGGVVLICWEHHHIPTLAAAIPTLPDTVIPPKWPGDRFDVIWRFTLATGESPTRYHFTQIPQQLLAGDTDTIIPN